MIEILMKPIPTVMFNLLWWNGGCAPVYWARGYYRLQNGQDVNFPEVRVRKWHPGYWLLLWRLKRGHRCFVTGACPLPDMVYEVYLGETPNMATQEDVREYVKRVNEPYDWPKRGAA